MVFKLGLQNIRNDWKKNLKETLEKAKKATLFKVESLHTALDILIMGTRLFIFRDAAVQRLAGPDRRESKSGNAVLPLFVFNM